MSAGLYSHTTRGAGTILTAAIYNSDHTNHITNSTPSMQGGYSDSVGEMRAMSSPGGVGSELLTNSLAGEIERIRFAINRIVGKTHWYEAPDQSIQTITGASPMVLDQTGFTPLTLRRNENDTTEREIQLLQSGSGAGAKLSTRVVGGAANDIIQLRRYLGAVEIDRLLIALYTLNIAMKVGANLTFDPSGYLDLKEIAAPANPAAITLRLYVKDVSGTSRLAYRNAAGVEVVIDPALVANEAFVVQAHGRGLAAGGMATGSYCVTGSVRNSAGNYTVTMSPALADANFTVAASVVGATSGSVRTTNLSASTFQVDTTPVNSAVATDRDFSFIVAGRA